MAESAWNEMVNGLAETMGMSELSRQSGTNRNVIYKWLAGTPPTADAVIKFARHLGMNPATALVTAGHLSPDDVPDPGSMPLASATDDALLNEIRRRINR